VRVVLATTTGDVFTLVLAAATVALAVSAHASARAARQAVEQYEEPYVIAVPTPPEVWGITKAGEVAPFDIHGPPQIGHS